MSLLRSLGTILLSVFAGGLAIGLVETAGHAVIASGARAPSSTGFAVAVFAWAIGTAIGVHLVARFNRQRRAPHVRVVVALFVLLTAINLLSRPHPVWVYPAAAVAIGVGWWLGVWSAPIRE